MNARYNPLEDSIKIMTEGVTSVFDRHEISIILEDVNSPVRMKYNQKLYDSVINKKHIDFDDIPLSKGDITRYSGYKNMMEVLNIISNINEFNKTNVDDYVKTVKTAVENIEGLKSIYTKGFDTNCEYVMLEYNIMVYTCVEATTSILYEFVDYIKRPGFDPAKITFKNTKYRPNLLYIEQLEKFNNVNKNMLGDYRKFLLTLIDGEKENFVGSSFMVGAFTIGLVAASIIPITRTLVYKFYNTKRKLSESLMYQAMFLEMHKAELEASSAFTTDKKKKIIERQDKIRKKLIMLAEKLRVEDVKSSEVAKRQLISDNKSLSVANLKKSLDDDDLGLM